MRIFYFFRSPLSFKYGTLFVRHDVPYMRPGGNGTPNFSRLFPTRSLDGGGGWCYYRGMKKQDDEWLGFFLMGLLVLTIFLV